MKPKDDQIAEIRTRASNIRDSLAQRPGLPAQYSNWSDTLDYIQELMGDANEWPLETMPRMQLAQIRQHLGNVNSAIGQIGDSNTDLSAKFSAVLLPTVLTIQGAMSYVIYEAQHYSVLRTRANERITELDSYSEQGAAIVRTIESTRDDAERAAIKTKAILGKAGAGRFAETFAKRSDKLEDNAQNFFRQGLVFGILTIVAACLFIALPAIFPELAFSTNASQATLQIIARLTIIGALAALTAWSLRQYRVCMHLSEVNAHRALALDTYRLFVESAHGDPTRDEILKSVASTIFSPAMTGFIDPKAEAGQHELREFFELASRLKS